MIRLNRMEKCVWMSKKLLTGLGRTSAVNTKVPARTMYPQISSNVVSGPPRNKISFAEKVAVGAFMALSIVATPAWILYHFDCYRVLKGQEKEGSEEE